MLGCDTYDIKVVPTTSDEILAALDHHTLSGPYERFLFNTIVHAAFMADSKDNPEELESLVHEAMTAALQHLQSISEYSIIPSQVIMSAPVETVYTAEPPNSNTTSRHDLRGTSSSSLSKMGEGGNGPSHCPLPKVLVRSEDDPQ